jgi:hypothetical protein
LKQTTATGHLTMPRKLLFLFICTLALLVALVSGGTSAQIGGGRPTPSGTFGAGGRSLPTRNTPDRATPERGTPAMPTRGTPALPETTPLAPSDNSRPTRVRPGSGGSSGGVPTIDVSMPTLDFPTLSAPAASDEAAAALTQFNGDHLGAVLDLVYAGAATVDVETVMQYLPAEMQAAMLNATTISGLTYWGVMRNGAAMVAVGDCSTDPAACTVTADTLSMQLSSAASGTYGVLVNGNVSDAQAALNLIVATYSKLSGLSFSPITIEQGWAFSASTFSMGIDPVTRQPVSAATVIYAGVGGAGSQTFVYALAAIGEGYVSAVT